jgi:hypothetical protein
MRCAIDSKCHPKPHPRRLHEALSRACSIDFTADRDAQWSRECCPSWVLSMPVLVRRSPRWSTLMRRQAANTRGSASRILSTPAGEFHGSVSREGSRREVEFLVVAARVVEVRLDVTAKRCDEAEASRFWMMIGCSPRTAVRRRMCLFYARCSLQNRRVLGEKDLKYFLHCSTIMHK